MSTELVVQDKIIAVRNAARGGPVVNMQVTKKHWEHFKNKQANTDRMDYDLATANTIVRDWVNQGATVKWKTAKDWNDMARELENHRFRNHPDAPNFSKGIADVKRNASETMRDMINIVK